MNNYQYLMDQSDIKQSLDTLILRVLSGCNCPGVSCPGSSYPEVIVPGGIVLGG